MTSNPKDIGADQAERLRDEAERAARARRPETKRECGPTHYHACACRERYFDEITRRLDKAADADRVVAWINNPVQPSFIHFTSGAERQIAYAVDEIRAEFMRVMNKEHKKLKLAEEALEIAERELTYLVSKPERRGGLYEQARDQVRTALAELRKA